MLDPRALRMFVALAEERHFGRTAERLGVAQSVLSTQILRLEDRIGARLFSRGRRSVVSITPAGEVLLVEAQSAIAQLERAERIGRMAGRGEAGTANIGFVFSAVMSGVFPTALTAIRDALPQLAIAAEPMETPEQIAALADGRLDVGFIRPRPTYPENVEAHVLHAEALLVALAADHPLAGRAALSPGDLAGETFIFPQFGANDGFAETTARLLGNGAFEPARTLRTRDFVAAISLASAGYGIVLAPTCMRRMQLDSIVYRPLTGQHEAVHLAVAWNRHANPRLVETVLTVLPPLTI
jgi:DNA-binding transcriptional LysR family regulator